MSSQTINKYYKNLHNQLSNLKNADAGILFLATILVNAGNYALNLLLGRFLGPVIFAEASVLATAVLMLSFIALGFQLTTAKFVAAAEVDQEDTASLRNFIAKKAKWISVILSAGFILCAKFIQSYLQFESVVPLIILFASIPFYIEMSINRGYLQGVQSFKKMAASYVVEMVARLIVTFVLLYAVFYLMGVGASESIAIGFACSFIASWWVSRTKFDSLEEGFNSDTISAMIKFITIIMFYEFSQILINNSDVILVKHFFDNEQSGMYSALALIGRVVFFATWTIVTLLFPKVIEREKKGLKHADLFWKSLAIVSSVGVLIIGACYFMDELIIQLLYGSAYMEVAPYLYLYAIATTLFACANVFAYYFMSLSKYIPVLISIVVGILQLVSIYFFHGSLLEVIWVQIYLMLLLFISMSFYYLFVNFVAKQNKSLAFE